MTFYEFLEQYKNKCGALVCEPPAYMYEKKTIEEVCKQLSTDKKRGLYKDEVEARRQKYGRNELKEGKQKTVIETFFEQNAEKFRERD